MTPLPTPIPTTAMSTLLSKPDVLHRSRTWPEPAKGGVQDEVASTLARLRARPLESLGDDPLMDRLDRKFLIPAASVTELLDTCRWSFDVLEVDGIRLHPYRTLYLDTPDLHFYRQHHGGRGRRQKVRVREYLATSDRYLEVKARFPNGRTLKTRRVLPADAGTATGIAPLLLDHRRATWAPFGLCPLELFPSPTLPFHLVEAMEVEYRRLTLLSRQGLERVTVDLGLEFTTPPAATGAGEGLRRAAHGRWFPETAVVEVKQDRRGPSPVLEWLAHRGVRGLSFSKYCTAVALLRPDARHNRFKPALRRLRQVENLG